MIFDGLWSVAGMLISLGYSCQSRFSIDAIGASQSRFPFDFNITTKQGLIRTLATDGASLQHDQESVAIYQMPVEGRQGLSANGIFFWHDYRVEADKLTLSGDWPDHIDAVNQKYDFLWKRFSSIVRDNRINKTFIMSNSQFNLQEFAQDATDFSQKFGLKPKDHEEISAALYQYGANNFTFRFITRNLDEYHQCNRDITDNLFECFFAGKLSLPTNNKVALSLAGLSEVEDIDLICGSYDEGSKRIERMTPTSALILRNTENGWVKWGSIRSALDGYLATFDGRDKVFTGAINEANAIAFSNKTKWHRDTI